MFINYTTNTFTISIQSSTKKQPIMKQLMNEFKSQLRMNDYIGDRWGVAMGAFFQIAAHLYEIGDCPATWQYNVGCGGNHIDTEDSLYDFLTELNAEQLEYLGNYVFKLTNMLRMTEHAY